MTKVKGIYDGTNIVLLEPLTLPPNTEVEILIPEQAIDEEEAYLEELLALGLMKEVKPSSTTFAPVEPVTLTGKPLSDTIIEERR